MEGGLWISLALDARPSLEPLLGRKTPFECCGLQCVEDRNLHGISSFLLQSGIVDSGATTGEEGTPFHNIIHNS